MSVTPHFLFPDCCLQRDFFSGESDRGVILVGLRTTIGGRPVANGRRSEQENSVVVSERTGREGRGRGRGRK